MHALVGEICEDELSISNHASLRRFARRVWLTVSSFVLRVGIPCRHWDVQRFFAGVFSIFDTFVLRLAFLEPFSNLLHLHYFALSYSVSPSQMHVGVSIWC